MTETIIAQDATAAPTAGDLAIAQVASLTAQIQALLSLCEDSGYTVQVLPPSQAQWNSIVSQLESIAAGLGL